MTIHSTEYQLKTINCDIDTCENLFQQCNLQTIVLIMNSSHIHENETLIFKVLMKWLLSRPGRLAHLNSLLFMFRLGYVDTNNLRVLQHPKIRKHIREHENSVIQHLIDQRGVITVKFVQKYPFAHKRRQRQLPLETSALEQVCLFYTLSGVATIAFH